jgi:hypothetical protein
MEFQDNSVHERFFFVEFSYVILCGLLFFLFLTFSFSVPSKSTFRLNGEMDFSTYQGEEETFLDSINGLSTLRQDLDFHRYDVGMDLLFRQKMGALELEVLNRADLDLFSEDNLIFRDSNGNNLLEIGGQAILSPGWRLRGRGLWEVFDDRSFPEYSNDDLGGIFEIEHRIRPRVSLNLGYEVHDREYDTSIFDNYRQRDFYLGYYRFSPAKTTLKPVRSESEERVPGELKSDQFVSETRNALIDEGFFKTATLIPSRTTRRGIYGFLPYTVDSPMSFELEGRIRHRELYNSLEKSYLEGQINGVAQFFLSDNHEFRIDDQFSDRDYSSESLADNLLSYQRNIAVLSHFLSFSTISFDTSLELDSTFYKSRPLFDNLEWEFQSSVSWDVLNRWNLSWYHVFANVAFEMHRYFFTNWDYQLRSFTSTISLGDGFMLKGSFDREKKEFHFFENSIDSSFNKKGQDYRVIYNISPTHQIHAGFRWERERHFEFSVNDRYEELGYVGTRLSL